MESKYKLPKPLINVKEKEQLMVLTKKSEEMNRPGIIAKAGAKVGELVPQKVRVWAEQLKEDITAKELYARCMEVVAEGFSVLEKQAAKMSISKTAVIKNLNKLEGDNEIVSLEEVCLLRSYDIYNCANRHKGIELGAALIEGGATGYAGFAGLPFNIVLSLFLYYRAVQTVAMFYGYDVKEHPEELVVASQVFVNALNPMAHGEGELAGYVGKIMLVAEMEAVKQAARKTWEDMAAHGGVCLLLAQMRAMAHKSARVAIEKAGKKGLENSLFSEVFEQLGKRLGKKAIGKSIPVFGAIVSALFDTAQMNKIVDYANVFYCNRFLYEKEVRINILISEEDDMA